MKREQIAEQLEKLRLRIDATDSQLVHLLQQRQELAARIGAVKRQLGEPLYVPEREATMFMRRREEAQQLGISPDLIEDVLRRVIRDSYQQQQAADVHLQGKQVVIIGGGGAMGQLFAKLFSNAGAKVHIIEPTDWAVAPTYCQHADLVLLSVPLTVIEQVILDLPVLPPSCILADLTSVKELPLAAMLTQHSGPVVGLHPMFGPQQATLAKQLVIACHGRDEEGYRWLLQAIEHWGARIKFIAAAEHDQAMSFVQVLRHLSSFVYGVHLAHEQVDVQQLVELSSPIYHLELMMVGRLFAQDAHLYADIIAANPSHFKMLRRYVSVFDKILEEFEQGNKADFIERFNKVRQYFGELAHKFLSESQRLLDVTSDTK